MHEFPLRGIQAERAGRQVHAQDEKGCITLLPIHYTDLIEPDSYVFISEGRSMFRPKELLELVRFLKGLKDDKTRLSRKKRKSNV